MRRIYLYINEQLVDTDDQSFILFNYTRDAATSPAIVKNSYTQKINLPGTARNNKVFEGFCNLDRATNGGLNPLAKNPFVIYDDMGAVLERGYFKFETYTLKKNRIVSYAITLYGGLGGYFYNMTYKSDGSKKSLADIVLLDSDREFNTPSETSLSMDASTIKAFWDDMGTGNRPLADLINFAPAYNGFPGCEFDANKAVYKPVGNSYQLPNLYVSKDGYSADPDANGTILLNFANKHTEWETQDLRAYLQRPVINLQLLVESIANAENTGSYNVVIESEDFFNSDWWTKTWITLGMFDRDNIDPTEATLADILKGTDSPAEYLIAIAKAFGLCFVYDAPTNTITICTRNRYYGIGEEIDLTKRIQHPYEVNPLVMDNKYYVFSPDEVYGEWTKEYEEKYGRDYGSAWMDTGFEFNADQTDVMSGAVLKGAADVLESNINYQVFGGNADDMGAYQNSLLKFALTEGKVSWNLYKTESGEKKSLSCEPSEGWIAPLHYSKNTSNYNDFFVKPQLHASDNKSEDGRNVLLFLQGKVNTPYSQQGSVILQSVDFHLSDDTDAMLYLNGGKPCWDVSPYGSNIVDVTSMPQFRRWEFIYDDSHDGMSKSLDYGDPREIATNDDFRTGKGMFNAFWKAYMEDRFDVDSKVVTAKVDMAGLQVNGNLLRNFYYFDNCVWSLNRIINHSLTTFDNVECEFIKVKDMANYISGQKYDAGTGTDPQFNTEGQSISASGQTIQIGVVAAAGVSWTIGFADSTSASAISIQGQSVTSYSGTGSQTLNITFAENTGTASRTLGMTLKNSSMIVVDSATFTQATESFSIAFSRSLSDIPFGGATITATITSTKAWRLNVPSWVTASSAEGTGSATITLTAASNTGDARTGSLSVLDTNNVTLYSGTMSQDAYVSEFSITLDKDIASIPASGETIVATIVSNQYWEFMLPSWITPSQESGTGNASVTLTIPANTGNVRSSQIGVVNQAYDWLWSANAMQETPTATFAISFSRSLSNLPAEGATITATITSNQTWNITLPSWVSASASQGTGNATLTLTAATNTGATRQGSLVVKNTENTTLHSESMSQVAAAASDSFSILIGGQGTLTYEGAEQTATINIVCSNSSSQWKLGNSAYSGSRWFSVDGQSPTDITGTGSRDLILHLDSNTSGESRQVTIVLRKANNSIVGYLRITQEALATTAQIVTSVDEVTIGAAAGSASETISIEYQDCHVVGAGTNQSWLTWDSEFDMVVTATQANTTGATREGQIYLYAKDDDNNELSKTIIVKQLSA